jgi:hypothetical protein
MDELLTRVLEVHGGLDNWSRLKTATARLSLGGPFWDWKGWPAVYANQTVTLDVHQEQIRFQPFPAPNLTSVFSVAPERIEIRTLDGTVVEGRDAPRSSFPVYTNGVAWDAIQVAYFTSAATWNYLTAPFVFTYDGVGAKEIDPWRENGHEWRRLEVTFPHSIPNHNADQVFYYDADFHQRRMDYQPDVTGSPIAHYTYAPRIFDGFLFYTQRLVHLRGADNVANQEFAPISIDIESIELS